MAQLLLDQRTTTVLNGLPNAELRTIAQGEVNINDLANTGTPTRIGLVTLIGLISKHGILMVAFANTMQVSENLDRSKAIIRAARIRLRPILMTTGAMTFGVTPLLFASGAGAASRVGLGWVLTCGMLLGILFTLFVLPTIYAFLARDHRVHSERQQIPAELDPARETPARSPRSPCTRDTAATRPRRASAPRFRSITGARQNR